MPTKGVGRGRGVMSIGVHDLHLWLERETYGEYHHLVKSLFIYEYKFFEYFRMTPLQFNEVMNLSKRTSKNIYSKDYQFATFLLAHHITRN
jgi:hypothetical protein